MDEETPTPRVPRKRQHDSLEESNTLAQQTHVSTPGTITSEPSPPRIEPPSDRERAYYYFGLTERSGTDPRLVARSSTDPFHDTGYFGAWPGPEPRRKYEFCVGNHPITRIYDAGPRYQIRDALWAIPWQTIDIVRIGTSLTALENPVIILISVPKDSISYITARDAINRCLDVLAQ